MTTESGNGASNFGNRSDPVAKFGKVTTQKLSLGTELAKWR